jgi:SAM-dependent methyltransferase
MSDDVGAYYDDYWRERPSPLSDPLALRRLSLLRELLPGAPGRVLDVGAGAGDVVAALAADGYDATGFDVSSEAVALAEARYPGRRFVHHSAERLPWPVEAGSVDIVISFEVIEHLLQPNRLIEGARQALRPGGRLAISTPYHGYLKNLVIALTAFDDHFDVGGDHIRFFSPRSLGRLLESNGFDVERTFRYGRAPGVWANMLVWARKR